MPYLVDGHNLIPKLGLRLDALDDEEQLISRLQEFCRLRRIQVEVYFDGAPPGQVATRRAGLVTAHFVRQGSSADAAIELQLARLGKAARNWTVVSSDGRVRRAAAAAHAGSLTSEEFAQEISRAQLLRSTAARPEAGPVASDVEEWMEIFTRKRD